MPNKEALIRKLSAMSGSRKAEAPTESNSGRRFEDDEAQLYEYDKVLRAFALVFENGRSSFRLK